MRPVVRLEARRADALAAPVEIRLKPARGRRQPGGPWMLENTHPGLEHVEMEDGEGRPSRWNTLRALRVLRWYGRVA